MRSFLSGFTMALGGSVLLLVVGLFIALSDPSSDLAGLGWFFVVLGVIFLAANLALRGRMR